MSHLQHAKNFLLVASLATTIFLAGRLSADRSPAELEAAPSVASPSPVGALALPQGRTTKRGTGATGLGGDETLVFESGSTGSASSDGFLAVTGSYGIGTQVLYLVDTKKRQLAVYEARGGSSGSRRVALIGARRIDLDLELEGYNDNSEFSYAELTRKFEKARGGVPAATGAELGAKPEASAEADKK